MTQEEKAKAYDKAINAIKELKAKHPTAHVIKDWIKENFPELAESEDEMIRKSLIKSYTNQHTSNFPTTDGFTREQILAWLEKQGEIDKVYEVAENEKRKFVGDGFINCYADFQDFKEGKTYWLEYIGNDNYNVRSDNLLGKTYHITPCQLYTIFKKQTWLEKQGEQKTGKVEPKFKVGDKIIEKDFDECGCGTIIDIKDGKYIFDDGSSIYTEERGLWKLIERKPANKVGPKFKVDDWVVWNNKISCHVDNIYQGKESLMYTITDTNNVTSSYSIKGFDNNARLWTIQDAKDGDVLVRKSGWTCIFKTLVNDETFSSYCFMDKTKWFCKTGSECHTLKEEFVKAYNGKIYPATKEQCELLFSKIHEAGYEWDAEKKELKKIEVNTEELSDFERSLKHIIEEAIEDGDTHNLKTDADMLLRIAQKSKSTWDEEDEKYLQDIIEILDCLIDDEDCGDMTYEEHRINWLKSLKNRVQPKQEWSDEDGSMLYGVMETEQYMLDVVNGIKKFDVGNGDIKKACAEELEWLKSLKDRVQVQPQNVWISVDEEVYVKEPVLAQKKDKSDPFDGFVVCCDHILTPNVYERYMILTLGSHCCNRIFRLNKES